MQKGERIGGRAGKQDSMCDRGGDGERASERELESKSKRENVLLCVRRRIRVFCSLGAIVIERVLEECVLLLMAIRLQVREHIL